MTRPSLPDIESLDARLLLEIERTAVAVARLAGAEIVTAFGGMLAIKYKSDLAGAAADALTFRDPVSEVDQRVERLVRAQITERFPDHRIIGEEIKEHAAEGALPDFIWVIDPIDGTANFINGFPLFAASIGVLYRGVPVVGALWCAATHALRAGVYHARVNGRVCFDEAPLETRVNPAVRRRLLGDPGGEPVGNTAAMLLEPRKTGSAAIECAFVAAGILKVARFERPNIWDVAGGLALVRAAGSAVQVLESGHWVPFDGFDPIGLAEHGLEALLRWRRGLVLGEEVAVADLCKATAPRPL
jgi:myo-inositol-1(or 4)-monophosphatase